MNTPSEETLEDSGNQIRKSSDSGGKPRRYSIGITTSRKSAGEPGGEGSVPNYLRASTGSCHDFCKYGKQHEHSKSAIPVNFIKKTALVNKEKVTTVVLPLERVKKLKPLTYPKIRMPAEPVEVTKRVVSKPILSTNGKGTGNEIKTLRRSTSNGVIKNKDIKIVKKTPKTDPVKKVPTESQSPKASFRRATSLKAIKYRSVKQVTPLKNQNKLQKFEPKKSSYDKIWTKNLHGAEASEVKPETVVFDFPPPSMELVNAPACNSSESLSWGIVAEEESTIIHPVYENSQLFLDKELLEESLIVKSSELLEEQSMELVNNPACNISESFSEENVAKKESTIISPAYESSELFPDKQLLEEPSIAPPVSENSESFYGEEDDVSGEESESTDNEKVFATTNNDEMETWVGDPKMIPRKGRRVISEDKDDEAVKLRFRRGKILDLQSENNNIPRRLKFRRGKVVEGKQVKQHIGRRSFEKKYVEEVNNSKTGRESVVLKHQVEQEKKDAQGLFNNVIEETASKLVETRKSKVKALVGAFETVISLQDGNP